MAEIIHDPTRGWLLLTEKWPGGEFPETMDNINLFLVHRNSCLSTAIEIDKNDMADVIMKIPAKDWTAKDHHPYSVDAEFEVVDQCRFAGCRWGDSKFSSTILNPELEHRQIARLVKAKENSAHSFTEGYDMNEYEKTKAFMDAKKPTESQDELWDEVMDIATDKYWRQGYSCPEEELRAKFRIERI